MRCVRVCDSSWMGILCSPPDRCPRGHQSPGNGEEGVLGTHTASDSVLWCREMLIWTRCGTWDKGLLQVSSHIHKQCHFFSLSSNAVCFSVTGGRVKTWKRRWFILTDNCLYYFEYTTVSKFGARICVCQDRIYHMPLAAILRFIWAIWSQKRPHLDQRVECSALRKLTRSLYSHNTCSSSWIVKS